MDVLPHPATTGKALVEHWGWAAEKGLMNKNTAAGLRAACVQVLSVLDNWETTELRHLDVDETLRRFQNLRIKNFKPQSLEVYKRRFRQALASYTAFLANPGAWRPLTHERPQRGAVFAAPDIDRAAAWTAGHVPNKIISHEEINLITYPFPLRSGTVAQLMLPTDLTLSEVNRLAAFMRTLAIDFDSTSL
jgi:hypothetical protein